MSKLAFIRLTTLCNGRCPMCSVWKREPEFFEFEKIKSLIKNLNNFGYQKFLFTGGEPTLYQHFSKLNKYLAEHKLEFGLITNGSVVEQRWDELFQYQRPSYIIISLDDVTGQYHDQNRGIKDLHKKTISAIYKILEKRIPCSVNTVITKKNIHLLNKFIDQPFLSDISEWHWIPVKFLPELSLDVKDWKEIYRMYQEIKSKKIVKNLVTTFDFMDTDDSFENFTQGLYTENFYKKCDCSIAEASVFIEVNGDVYRCNSFDTNMGDKVKFGNINKMGIGKVMHNVQKGQKLLAPACRNCDPRNQKYNKVGLFYEGWLN